MASYSKPILLLFLASFLFSFQSRSQESKQKDYQDDFIFKHRNCELKLEKSSFFTKKFNQTIQEKIKKKNLQLKIINQSRKILAGDLYLTIQLQKIKKGIYHDCSVEIFLKKAKSRGKSKSDKIYVHKKVIRKYPRLTRKGNERCIRALKDTFIHIPSCEKN